LADSSFNESVIVGRVMGAFGIKGQIKVRSYTESPHSLLTYSVWTLCLQANDPLSYVVKSGRLHGQLIVAQLEGVDTRDQALELKGRDISILTQTLPKLPDGEYYHHQLIDMKVIDIEGHVYGHVKDIMQTGANDVLMVEQGDSTCLIPYIEEVIEQVNLELGTILVRWYLDQ